MDNNPMISGKIYVYPRTRCIYSDKQCIEQIGDLDVDEPFIFLGEKKVTWIQSFKILTSKGIVGWVEIGFPDLLKTLLESDV